MKNFLIKLIFCFSASALSFLAWSQEPKESEVIDLSATIVGNQEQPTVLYIVPWKPADDTTILYLPLSSKAMEQLFGHVERVEHQRQVQYIDELGRN